MDEIDRQLLHLLQQDGRMSYAALGTAVHLTASSVYARVRRLEKEGVILGYTTLINPAALQQNMLAYTRLQSNASGEEFAAFEAYVATEPQILECHDVAGEDSYLLKIRTSGPEGLQALIAAIRRALPGSRAITSIVMLMVKEFQRSGVATPVTDKDDPGKENS